MPPTEKDTRKGSLPKDDIHRLLGEPISETLIRNSTTIKYYDSVTVVKNAKKIIAVPDIHGDLESLVEHLVRAQVLVDNDAHSDKPRTNPFERYSLDLVNLVEGTQIVFLGDYVDRGPDSMGVIDMIRKIKREAKESDGQITVHDISGNHDEILLRFIETFKRVDQKKIESYFEEFANLAKDYEDNKNDPVYRFGYQIMFPHWEGHVRIYKTTYNSIIKKYGNWKNACSQMEQDGTIDFLSNLRGAVIIDNLFFTHAGPILTNSVMGTTGREEMIHAIDEHYTRIFEDRENHWSELVRTAEIKKRRDGIGDYSCSHADEWIRNPGVDEFMKGLGIDHIYVGHRIFRKVQVIERFRGSELSKSVTVLDAGITRAYRTGEGGVLVIDPSNAQPIRMVYAFDEQKNFLPKETKRETDISMGRPLVELLDNEYTRAMSETG